MRASPSVANEQAFFLQLRIRARNRIWCNTEIAGELAHRGETIAWPQFTALYQIAKLIHHLLKRCEIGIDCEEKFFHESESARLSRWREYRITHTANPAHKPIESIRKSL